MLAQPGNEAPQRHWVFPNICATPRRQPVGGPAQTAAIQNGLIMLTGHWMSAAGLNSTWGSYDSLPNSTRKSSKPGPNHSLLPLRANLHPSPNLHLPFFFHAKHSRTFKSPLRRLMVFQGNSGALGRLTESLSATSASSTINNRKP